MDEQRERAYVELIQLLLGCPNGEEAEILQAHGELLDVGLIEGMQQYASNLDNQGNGNAAQRLLGLSRQLTERLGIADFEAEESLEDSERFLFEVLQLVAKSNGDAQQVYPFLEQHQNRLTESLLQILPKQAARLLAGDIEEPSSIAAILYNFGNLINQFSLGQRGLNPELGITAYKMALEVYTREAFPTDWAGTQNNLATAYINRIRGDRADNLEQALAANKMALEVYTREAFPEQWAMTQNNLAIAYTNRIRGDRADNLEQALSGCKLALKVYTQEAFPEQWARTQNNLAFAYHARIRGDRADNIEQAISGCKLALEVYTREAFRTDWAITQNNLAFAYHVRIRGDRADNIEQALAAYKMALEVYTREAFPTNWAMTQHNLAIAYHARIRGDRADNLEQALSACKLALEVYTREVFRTDWAMTQYNLATAYINRIRGDRADNLEQALSACKLALEVYTREAFPTDWAGTQNNLALAYSDRIWGDRADNIEQALAAHKIALEVYTREAFPTDWAMTQYNLANAYNNRIRGDRADNIEQALAANKMALEVYTREAFPEQWATTQNNLASAYTNRIRGDRADNIEQALAANKMALEVRTREAFPEQWAMTQYNLASAYTNRIRGDRADNIEQALAAYKMALEVRTREAFPEQWATTQNNLAIAYNERIRGDRADNIEQALAAYKMALEVYTREAFPEQWAMTQNNLAIAYTNRIRGDRADNIEQALAANKMALEVYTREAFPEQWATTQNNLAIAYTNRIRGDRADNIEQALAANKMALEVYTREAFPEQWAGIQNNLANAYRDRIRGDRADNIEQALAAYKMALEVRTREAFPKDCLQTARSFGNLYFEQQIWAEAASTYTLALQASEILYQSSILLDSKAAELAATNDLPRRAAYALARSGHKKAAALTLELGRARGLSETLDRDHADLTELQQKRRDLYTKYQEITTQLRNFETQERLRMTSDDRHSLTPEIFRAEAQKLRQTLTETITQIRLVPGYENFLAQPNFDDIRQALRPNIPLIYLIPTPAGSLALIVTENGIADLWFDDFTETRLQELLVAWFKAYDQSQTNRKAWLEEIDEGTRQLWQPLMAPLINHLQQHNFQQATLIPTGLFGLLPLHAAWTEDHNAPTGRLYALDAIHFTYASNARSLSVAQEIAQRTVADSILAIDNPRGDLPNSTREVTAAVATFGQHKILQYQQATIESVLAVLPDYNVLHLSCHGIAYLREPLSSGLAMSDGLLTLRDLLDLKLDGIRLVILSACETGLTGIDLADEAISLPTGLLQAGVAGVAATLWSVSDLSTMMLLTCFYDKWRIDHLEIDQALRQAQQWVRDSTNGEKVAYFKASLPEFERAKMPASTASSLYQSVLLSNPNGRDFAHPFHWAAFHYLGV